MKFTSVSKLKPGMRIAQELIGIDSAKSYPIGCLLSKNDIAFLTEKGVSGVYTMDSFPAEILSPGLMSNCMSALKKRI